MRWSRSSECRTKDQCDGNHYRQKNYLGINFQSNSSRPELFLITYTDFELRWIFFTGTDFDFSRINSAMVSVRNVCGKG